MKLVTNLKFGIKDVDLMGYSQSVLAKLYPGNSFKLRFELFLVFRLFCRFELLTFKENINFSQEKNPRLYKQYRPTLPITSVIAGVDKIIIYNQRLQSMASARSALI